MKSPNSMTASLCLSLVVMLCAGNMEGQKDPGPRGGAAGAGASYYTLNSNEQAFFGQALQKFMEVDSVSGTIERGSGLGPTFNGNSCPMCHAEPAIGGSSPGLNSLIDPMANPQVGLAGLDGASNVVPSFITAAGPVREARFILKPDGARDGGVHDLYTITGRGDATGCSVAQPNFAAQLAANNVIFRIPTPLFGLGLVENTPDATLRVNLASTRFARSAMGIGGRFNTSGNDGTITRFGWKAQNKSLLVFVGEAYNVEQGVTNELFPNERDTTPGCVFNATPEDASNILNNNPSSVNYKTTIGTVGEMSSDVVNFAAFIRLSAPPTAAAPTSSTQNGASLFNSIGCALCHSASLTSGPSPYTGMSGVTYQPFSDFALHHMGSGLADGITQGVAGGDEFRTAPLWGLGQRLFFLHDGRTSDLLQAIQAHLSPCTSFTSGPCGSEANNVIRNFKNLSPGQQQDILNFLRSL